MTEASDDDLMLIERWRDAALSESELAALRARMRDDPSFRARFVDEARFHGLIAGLLGHDDQALLGRVESAVAGSRPSGLHRLADTVERRVERSNPRRPGGATRAFTRAAGRRSPVMRRIGVALAALIAVAVLWTMSHPRTEPIAEVVAASATTLERGGISRDLRADDRLESGDVVSVGNGSAAIAYADGTRIDLAVGSTAAFATAGGAKRIRLDRGVAEASVAKQPEGAPLEMATPHATIVVLGTRFILAVAATGTDLAVEEGRVAVALGEDRREVGAGQIAHADAGGLRTWPISPQALLRGREAIIAAIAPQAEDERLFACGWETDLQAARRRAAAEGKPLLIWAGWGHPFGMGNAETVIARRILASDRRFHGAVAGRFVPVALDPWMSTKADDDGGRFYRAAIASAGRKDVTNDGFFVVGADGRAAASCTGLATVDEAIAMLELGLVEHARQRGPALAVDDARDARFDHRLPPGGLALALRARRLGHTNGGWRADGGIGRDHLWLTADDCRALIADAPVGTTRALDPAVTRHVARYALADATVEEWIEWRDEDFATLAIGSEIVERTATRTRARLTGTIEADDGSRSCRVALIGDVVAEDGVITRCDLTCAGTFRDGAGERLVGIVGAIATGPIQQRVPPHGMRDQLYFRRD